MSEFVVSNAILGEIFTWNFIINSLLLLAFAKGFSEGFEWDEREIREFLALWKDNFSEYSLSSKMEVLKDWFFWEWDLDGIKLPFQSISSESNRFTLFYCLYKRIIIYILDVHVYL